MIALDTEAVLLDIGVGTVDTFGSAGTALSWLASETPDIAVLDINLGTTTAFPIAEELRRRAIPFVFTSGYGETARLPAAFAGAIIVAKPYMPEALRSALARSLGIGDTPIEPDDPAPV